MPRDASPPPTLLFMGRVFEDRWGGVREMAEAMLRAAEPLCAEQSRRIEVLVPRAGICPVTSEHIIERVLPRFAGSRLLWDHWAVPAYANRTPGAVLYNIKLVLPLGLRIPGFISIHDLMYFPQPAKYDWREYLLADSLYMRAIVPRSIRRAPLVHVDSHHTAADARDLFPDVASERLRTIHLGVDRERFAPRPPDDTDNALWKEIADRGLRAPYILYTGGLSRRKNIVVLLQAFRQFVERHSDYQLVVTGGAKPTVRDSNLQAGLDSVPRENLLQLGAVEARALELLYRRAAFFVFPSLYEGFGLPPLEAQAAGCPVVCSTAASLPEVVGQSALTFDPRSPDELLDCLEQMTHEETRAHYRMLGSANARRFSWTETARQWLALADEVHARGSDRR